jgi:hypothetical protein
MIAAIMPHQLPGIVDRRGDPKCAKHDDASPASAATGSADGGACGNGVHHLLHVLTTNCRQRQMTQQRLDVSSEPTSIRYEGGCFFGDLAPGQQATGLGVGQILVAQVVHGQHGLSLLRLVRSRVASKGGAKCRFYPLASSPAAAPKEKRLATEVTCPSALGDTYLRTKSSRKFVSRNCNSSSSVARSSLRR